MYGLVLSLLSLQALASPLESRQAGRAVVSVAENRGVPQQLASGVLYGIPNAQAGRPEPIPDVFYTDPKLKFFRAGGAQLFGVGQRGWHWGEYDARFQSTLDNYRTARKYGGEFQLLVHDIWGTDTADGGTHWPGDNGDWSSYDAYLNRLIADIKANDMIPGLKIDIWNEPDNSIFWNRPLTQYLDLWGRTFHRFRSEPSLGVPLIGPSHYGLPDPRNPWWNDWFNYIVSNSSAPDQYTWHLLEPIENPDNNVDVTTQRIQEFLANTGAPRGNDRFCVNEYINAGPERVNSANAWFIAGLERNDISGLRANWLSQGELHDFLAELVYRPNGQTAYQPNGQFQLYKYYAQSMTGTRVGARKSPDGLLDVFATRDQGVLKVLAGVRAQVGTWEIEVNGLQDLGFPADGQVAIRTFGFDDPGLRAVVNGPSDRGVVVHNYSGGVLRFPIFQTQQDRSTAWAFEIRRN